jgi:hypothetical protein
MCRQHRYTYSESKKLLASTVPMHGFHSMMIGGIALLKVDVAERDIFFPNWVCNQIHCKFCTAV